MAETNITGAASTLKLNNFNANLSQTIKYFDSFIKDSNLANKNMVIFQQNLDRTGNSLNTIKQDPMGSVREAIEINNVQAFVKEWVSSNWDQIGAVSHQGSETANYLGIAFDVSSARHMDMAIRSSSAEMAIYLEHVSSLMKKSSSLTKGVGIPLSLVSEAYDISKAKDKTKAIVQSASALVGQFGMTSYGMSTGATIGTALFPGAGTVVGAIGGGLLGLLLGKVGYQGGKAIAGSIYDYVNKPKPKTTFNPEAASGDNLHNSIFPPDIMNQNKEAMDALIRQNQIAAGSQGQTALSLLGVGHSADIAKDKLLLMPYPSYSFAKYNTLTPGSNNSHAAGGILTSPHLGMVGEAGPEAIIPLSLRMRSRALNVWERAGHYLGVRPYAEGGFAGVAPQSERRPKMGSQGQINLTVNINGTNLSITEIVNKMVPQIELALANAC